MPGSVGASWKENFFSMMKNIMLNENILRDNPHGEFR